MNLNRDSILAANHLKTETLEVPELGGSVIIRELTAAKARELNSIKDENMLPVMWVVASVVNEDGSVAFSAKDIPLFDNISQAAIRRISNAAIRLNGLLDGIEGQEKNSEASPG